MREIGHFISGKVVKGTSGRFGDVFDPNTGEVQAKVALAKHSEVEHAIANAQAAQPGWAATNPQRRARVMFKFLELVQKEYDSLAKLLSSEHGKTVPDARGVLYQSVVGAPPGRRAVTPLLLPTWSWLAAAGANDGLVPAASQRWGEVLREVDADHFAQIGWTRRFDAAELYAELLRELEGAALADAGDKTRAEEVLTSVIRDRPLSLPALATIWTRSTAIVKVNRGSRTALPNVMYTTREWNVAISGFEVLEHRCLVCAHLFGPRDALFDRDRQFDADARSHGFGFRHDLPDDG